MHDESNRMKAEKEKKNFARPELFCYPAKKLCNKSVFL